MPSRLHACSESSLLDAANLACHPVEPPIAKDCCFDSFEREVLQHLDAAYNLALWLTLDRRNAPDLVLKAYLRAFQTFGETAKLWDRKTWLLKIVHDKCYEHLGRKVSRATAAFRFDSSESDACISNEPGRLLPNGKVELLRQALEVLPTISRELIILHEFEGLSYKQIAEVTGMSMDLVRTELSQGWDRLVQWSSNTASSADPVD